MLIHPHCTHKHTYFPSKASLTPNWIANANRIISNRHVQLSCLPTKSFVTKQMLMATFSQFLAGCSVLSAHIGPMSILEEEFSKPIIIITNTKQLIGNGYQVFDYQTLVELILGWMNKWRTAKRRLNNNLQIIAKENNLTEFPEHQMVSQSHFWRLQMIWNYWIHETMSIAHKLIMPKAFESITRNSNFRFLFFRFQDSRKAW